MTSDEAYIVLNALPKIGPVRIRRLLKIFESPEAILSAPRDELRNVDGIGNEMASRISNWESHVDLDRELSRMSELGASVVTLDSPVYPPLLKQIYDPPVLLYTLGELKETDRHGIGIVGSRRATTYGLGQARKLGFQLANAGLCVVSGLARGIDTAAHEGAIAGNGRTVAVLGSGFGNLYPPENRALAEKIAEQGAVVSEFPIDYPIEKLNFPMRNRIVAGWGFGTVVVEAPVRSGSIITANQALEHGRTVYAVPGQADKPTSLGCNRLIQQGAKLIVDGGDVLDDIDTLFPTSPGPPTREEAEPVGKLSEEERAVHDALGSEELHADEIVGKTDLPSPLVTATLLRLQMKRAVKQLAGGYYVRLIKPPE